MSPDFTVTYKPARVESFPATHRIDILISREISVSNFRDHFGTGRDGKHSALISGQVKDLAKLRDTINEALDQLARRELRDSTS
jgi:hypothetical protein